MVSRAASTAIHRRKVLSLLICTFAASLQCAFSYSATSTTTATSTFTSTTATTKNGLSVPEGSGNDRRSFLSTSFSTGIASVIPAVGLPTVAGANSAATATSVMLPGSKKAFPLVSFGLQIYSNDVAYKLTLTALEAGYRNFFASVLAGNQKGFAKAIAASGIPRNELYICGTVLSNRAQGESAAYQKTKTGCLENIEAMSSGSGGVITDLDMIMLDYPGPDGPSIRGQWAAFLDFRAGNSNAPVVQDLAVSNFRGTQLDATGALVGGGGASSNKDLPCLNQMPYSLVYHPPGLLEDNAKRGIPVQSWSPLSRVLTDAKTRAILAGIGATYGKSAAQVGLRWILQTNPAGAGFTTQSKSASHFAEDLAIFDFSLTDAELSQLNALI